MTSERPVDFLIVGHGLAGGLLAWELSHRGARVRVVDRPGEHAAHPVAAGILNPVTGMRLALSWRVEEFLPICETTYRTLEKAFGEAFFSRKRLVRLFKDEGETALFEEKKKDPDYAHWLGDRLAPGSLGGGGLDPFGSFEILKAGWLAVGRLVDILRGNLNNRGWLVEEVFDYEDLDLPADPAAPVTWRSLKASNVIFCEGYRGVDNPWFDWLDYRLSKGEVVDIRTEIDMPDYILNKGKWILPTGDHTARVGATYSWESLQSGPSLTGMAEIMREVKGLTDTRLPVIGHRAGIRPGTNDSLPYLGRHPLEPRLAIFNGLGSKGSLQAPPLAIQLADHLLENRALDQAVDIRRRLKFLDTPLELPG